MSYSSGPQCCNPAVRYSPESTPLEVSQDAGEFVKALPNEALIPSLLDHKRGTKGHENESGLSGLLSRQPDRGEPKKFPHRLYAMMQDKKTTKEYIQWYEEGDVHGFAIRDVDAFRKNVLPIHFREITLWGSFIKQLSNYGFKKVGRSRTQACYVHKAGKFRQGRPDLLGEVRKPEEHVPVTAVWSTRPPPSRAFVIPATSSGALNLEGQAFSFELMLKGLECKVRELETELVGLKGAFSEVEADNRSLRDYLTRIETK